MYICYSFTLYHLNKYIKNILIYLWFFIIILYTFVFPHIFHNLYKGRSDNLSCNVSKKWGVFIFAENIKEYVVWKNKFFIIAIYTYKIITFSALIIDHQKLLIFFTQFLNNLLHLQHWCHILLFHTFLKIYNIHL